jgi:hypothetical protein
MAAASAGTYIPLGGAITGAVPMLTPANPATGTPGTVTVTVTGFFTFRTYPAAPIGRAVPCRVWTRARR